MYKVFFHYLDRPLSIYSKRIIRQFVSSIFEKEKTSLNRVDYIFCSDKFLLQLNKKFLGHSFYTDILTFDLSENQKGIVSEVYISIDRVGENAKKLHTLKNGLDQRVKTLEPIIIKAGQILEKELLNLGFVSN